MSERSDISVTSPKRNILPLTHIEGHEIGVVFFCQLGIHIIDLEIDIPTGIVKIRQQTFVEFDAVGQKRVTANE